MLLQNDWEAENEAMVEALKIRVQKLQKATTTNPFPEEGAPTNPDVPGTNAVLPIEAAAAVNAFDDGTEEEALETTVSIVVAPAKDAMDEITDAPESTADPK